MTATTIFAIAYILWSNFIGVIPSTEKNFREIEISKWNYWTDVNIKIRYVGKDSKCSNSKKEISKAKLQSHDDQMNQTPLESNYCSIDLRDAGSKNRERFPSFK